MPTPLRWALALLCLPGAGRSAQYGPGALLPAPQQVSPDPGQSVCFWQERPGKGLVRFSGQPVLSVTLTWVKVLFLRALVFPFVIKE